MTNAGFTVNAISWARLVAALFLLTCFACAHVPRQSESTRKVSAEASTTEFRTQIVSLGRDFLREIEIAADSIEAGTSDPRIQRSALLWKLSSVPAVEEAALREDLVIAMYDLAAFRAQTQAFLESPAGHESFGDQLPIALRALVRLTPTWQAAAASLGVHTSPEARKRFDDWVRAHPIEGLPFTRPTVVGAMAKTLRNESASIGEAVGGMQESLDRLEFRIGFVNEFALKQALWLSQLAAMKMAGTKEAAELTGMLGSTRSLIEGTPDLVQGERQAVLEDVERQRLETIATLQQERVILLAAIASERALVLGAVDEQRRLAMLDVDSLRVRVIADEFRVVDHVLWRLGLGVGALSILAGGGCLLLVLLLRQRTAA